MKVIIYGSERSSQVLKRAARGLETAETKSTEEYLSCRRNTRLVKQRAERQRGESEIRLYSTEYAIDVSLKFSV